MSGSIGSSDVKPVLGSDFPAGGRVEASKGKATPQGPTFATVLANAKPIVKGAESAASVLPGGPLVAAALKGGSSMAAAGAKGVGAPVGGGGGGGVAIAPRIDDSANAISPVANEGGLGAGIAGAEGGGGANIEGVLANSEAFNLYYLQLQEQMSAENRSYTTMSNVLKARHDTVKNAIGNIR